MVKDQDIVDLFVIESCTHCATRGLSVTFLEALDFITSAGRYKLPHLDHLLFSLVPKRLLSVRYHSKSSPYSATSSFYLSEYFYPLLPHCSPHIEKVWPKNIVLSAGNDCDFREIFIERGEPVMHG